MKRLPCRSGMARWKLANGANSVIACASGAMTALMSCLIPLNPRWCPSLRVSHCVPGGAARCVTVCWMMRECWIKRPGHWWSNATWRWPTIKAWCAVQKTCRSRCCGRSCRWTKARNRWPVTRFHSPATARWSAFAQVRSLVRQNAGHTTTTRRWQNSSLMRVTRLFFSVLQRTTRQAMKLSPPSATSKKAGAATWPGKPSWSRRWCWLPPVRRSSPTIPAWCTWLPR